MKKSPPPPVWPRRIPWVLLLWTGLLTLSAAACSAPDTPPDDAADSPAQPQYVTTIHPFSAILTPVVGDAGRVTTLLDPADSPHTYEPRPSDLRRVSGSTALFFGAPHLDGWATDLQAPTRIELLGLLPPEHRKTFEGAHGHDSSAATASAEGKIDPHFWTDPLAVRALLPALADTLCHFDATGCTTYRANADSFATELTALNDQLEVQMRPLQPAPVLLSQPFFRYFLQRYGLELVGVVEPRPGQEPSPRTLQAVVQRAAAEDVRAILVQEQLPARAAQAVAEAAGLPLVRLDPIGGSAGRRTYAELLQYNASLVRDRLTSPTNAP